VRIGTTDIARRTALAVRDHDLRPIDRCVALVGRIHARTSNASSDRARFACGETRGTHTQRNSPGSRRQNSPDSRALERAAKMFCPLT
jgi:hypothetical protein